MKKSNFLFHYFLLLMLIPFAVSCSEDKIKEKKLPRWPSLVLNSAQKAIVLQLAENEQYKPIMDSIRTAMDKNPDEILNDTELYDFNNEKALSRPALANAFYAYLYDDAAAAEKAIIFLKRLRTDFETCPVWDANIRMAELTWTAIGAWDLLKGGNLMNEADEDEIRTALCELTAAFYEKYFVSTQKDYMLRPTQNNHNIHTASVIAPAAIVFDEEAEEQGWTDAAFYELGHLFSPEGLYIQSDGGVSEGPHYFSFAMRGALPVFVSLKNAGMDTLEIKKNCSIRGLKEPWNIYECVDGDPYTFSNPLDGDLLPLALEWFIKIRMPNGGSPPIDDGNFGSWNESWLYEEFTGNTGYYQWHFDNIAGNPSYYGEEAGIFDFLKFTWTNPALEGTEPEWSPTQYLPENGQAVFRSGWGDDDIFFLMQAEKAPARMTVHDHVDNGAFQMFAYGEYLLMDPGYWKPIGTDNARTAHAANHSIILVNGKGPQKALLDNWRGQTDAVMQNTYDGNTFDYAEVSTIYPETADSAQILRRALFVRNRYVVIADSVTSETNSVFTWRVHGYAHLNAAMNAPSPSADYITWIEKDMGITDLASANYSQKTGGVFTWIDDGGYKGGKWEREKAGVLVYAQSTGSYDIAQAPEFGDGTLGNSTSKAWVHWNSLAGRGMHFVMDAETSIPATSTSFLAVLHPYKTDSQSPSDAEKAAEVELINTGTAGVIAYRITGGDGKIDIAIINETGLVSPAIDTVTTKGKFTLVSDINGAKSVFCARGTAVTIGGTPVTMDKSDASTFSYKE